MVDQLKSAVVFESCAAWSSYLMSSDPAGLHQWDKHWTL